MDTLLLTKVIISGFVLYGPVGFDKRVHHDGVIHSSFTALKMPSFHFFISLRRQPLIFLLSLQFHLSQKVIYWNYTIRSLFRLASFTSEYASKFPPCLSLVAHFFSSLNNTLSYGCASWFIHTPIEGHLGCSQLLAILNKAAINIPVQVFVWT